MNLRKNIIIIIVLITVFLFGCSNNENIKSNLPISKTDFYLGTVINIKIYDKEDEAILEKAFERIKDIESKMSKDIEDSEVSKINENAGLNFVEISEDTYNVIEKSIYYSEISKGYFDITIGPLVKLWNIGNENARVPSQDEINSNLNKIDYKNILLSKANNSVMLKNNDMVIDLGGIAKGYIADEIVELLKDNDVNSAIIDLGGNIFALGNKDSNKKWTIAIQNPFSIRGEYIGIIEVENSSIVTSGVYERFLEFEGKKYHHILNPYTGLPVENDLAGVSIISNKSIDGDALSTSIFSLGLKAGIELVEKIDNVEAVFITNDKEVYITSGLKDVLQITDKEFKIIH